MNLLTTENPRQLASVSCLLSPFGILTCACLEQEQTKYIVKNTAQNMI